jgi:glycosyltransferase involved in cell wall biosynthesis
MPSISSPLRFSVITCSWNSEPFIADCIASVLTQDYPNFEFVFVDGGSTDGTLERIQALGQRCKLLEGVRGGISRAMNDGLRAASGDIIVHLHADDYLLHRRVLGQIARLFQSSAAKWAFGRVLEDYDGRLIPEQWLVPRYSYRRLIHGNFIPHTATFVRRELFDQVGPFDETLRYAMDYDMWLRLGRVAEPLQLAEALGVFRRHAGSASTANALAGQREDFAVRLRYSGRSPWALVEHSLRYLVRRKRLKRSFLVKRFAAQ